MTDRLMIQRQSRAGLPALLRLIAVLLLAALFAVHQIAPVHSAGRMSDQSAPAAFEPADDPCCAVGPDADRHGICASASGCFVCTPEPTTIVARSISSVETERAPDRTRLGTRPSPRLRPPEA